MDADTPPDSAPKTDIANLGLLAEEVVVAYHERTKHHYHRYAAAIGYMDWATQPDPFRRYDGAPLVRLPLPGTGRAKPYWQLFVADNTLCRNIYYSSLKSASAPGRPPPVLNRTVFA